jgi:hypothetical protein
MLAKRIRRRSGRCALVLRLFRDIARISVELVSAGSAGAKMKA